MVGRVVASYTGAKRDRAGPQSGRGHVERGSARRGTCQRRRDQPLAFNASMLRESRTCDRRLDLDSSTRRARARTGRRVLVAAVHNLETDLVLSRWVEAVHDNRSLCPARPLLVRCRGSPGGARRLRRSARIRPGPSMCDMRPGSPVELYRDGRRFPARGRRGGPGSEDGEGDGGRRDVEDLEAEF